MSLFRSLVLLLAFTPISGFGAEQLINIDAEYEVRVWTFTPSNMGDGPWPLAILIPAGGGQEYTVKSQFWLSKEFTQRGWVIAVPVLPEGSSFYDQNGHNFDRVITELQANPNIQKGKSLLLGISSGGTSALDIAGKNPGNYYGVVAVPGRLKDDNPLPPLKGLPIFLRIADQDYFRWHKQLPRITERLESAGARVNAALVSDTRHIFKIDWDELGPWLESIK